MPGIALPFFPRQTLTGAFTYYSPPFDVTAYPRLRVELWVMGLIGTNPTVDVTLLTSDTLDRPFPDWSTASTFTQVTSGDAKQNQTPSNFSCFVAVKVVLGGTDPVATVQVIGAARTAVWAPLPEA